MKKTAPKHVLVVSADAPTRDSLLDLLTAAGYEVAPALTPGEAEESLRERAVDVVVVATTGRTSAGLVLLDALHQRRLHVPVILVAEVTDVELYLDAMNRGAFEYLVQPLSVPDFLATVRKALEWSPRRRRAA